MAGQGADAACERGLEHGLAVDRCGQFEPQREAADTGPVQSAGVVLIVLGTLGVSLKWQVRRRMPADA